MRLLPCDVREVEDRCSAQRGTVIEDIYWLRYRQFIDAVGASHLRLTYWDDCLEVMNPSIGH